jgi:hypothetical protein
VNKLHCATPQSRIEKCQSGVRPFVHHRQRIYPLPEQPDRRFHGSVR